VKIDLTLQNQAEYNQAVLFWIELFQSLTQLLSSPYATITNTILRMFWSCHQRFFKQLCLATKVPTIVAEAKQALANGMAVVIGLQVYNHNNLASWRGTNH